ncbi:MAG: group III truncated hemoglobin [Cypionkella sp.]|uniref:group III truncated hemoglobin n=1 Tax=Cypionkella sp. TaxID=2811411 RepID=UPI002ABC0B63|nr:group III truncated hemoglobin [Cypionkella sp.]MDZ4312350.1 group III truncated hemoglobin [Cypionkella sp.]MDZ4394929.1 group III truncated hemoglobin [Cypionkella sp.]
MSPLARFPISPDQIETVVAAFYAAVRTHPTLGPIFASHITDWPVHETKIVRFWRNAILLEGGYDGNPMAVHKAAGNVRPGMFDPWLALFDQTLTRELPPETAKAWSSLAHRIGRGLRYGLVDAAKTTSGVPLLR